MSVVLIALAIVATVLYLNWSDGKRVAFRFVWRHPHLTYANYPTMGHGFLQVGWCFWTWSYSGR